ncbi:MAG: RIP metalloprotease RseP [Gemmatimonadota bacterium]
MLITIVALLVVLGVLVFIHELGHFLAARWAGIFVHRFSLGIGNPIKALTITRGGTEYSVSWLPLGGYVKMATAEEEVTSSALEGGKPQVQVPPDQYFEVKPVWKRMVVILAGVAMNALFAFVVFSGLAAKNGRRLDPVTTVGRVIDSLVPPGAEALRQLREGDRITAVNGKPVASWDDIVSGISLGGGGTITLEVEGRAPLTLAIPADALEDRLKASLALEPSRAPVVGQVLPGRPGERAGLEVGDSILAANGEPLTQWWQLVNIIQQSAGKPLTLAVARGGQRLEVVVTPEPERVPSAGGPLREVGKIGVGVKTETRSEPYTVLGAVRAGAEATFSASTQIVRAVQGMISGRTSARSVGGPILIGQMAGQAARLGLDDFLAFMALISVNLAVLNLLPIPVLDGGQFLFLVAEAVLRRPLSLRLRERLTMAGLAVVAMLILLAFSNDIMRLVGR